MTRAGSDGVLREQAEAFVHVAQVAAAAADLSARASAGLRVDVRLLRAELGRERLRAGVVGAMIESIAADLVPALGAAAGASVLAARPSATGQRLASA